MARTGRFFFAESAGTVRPFMRRLGLLLVCTVIANGLSLLSLFLLARIIGPRDFGLYYLLISAVNIFVVPVAWGLGTSTVKQLASGVRPSCVMGSALVLACMFLAIIVGLSVALLPLVSTDAQLDMRSLLLPMQGFTVATVFGVLMDSYLRGLRRTRALGFIRVLSAGINLLACVLLIWMGVAGPQSPLLTRSLELGIFALATMVLLRYVEWPDWNTVHETLRYAVPASVAVCGLAVFSSLDKFLVAHLLDLTQAGRYSIAFVLSYTLVSRGADIVLAVLFPEAVSSSDKAVIAKRLNHLTPKLLLTVAPAVFVVTWLVIAFLGAAFDVGYWHMILFSLGGAIFFASNLHWWMIASTGNRGVASFAAFSCLSCGSIVGANLLLVPRYGLDGAVAALLIGTLFLFFSGNVLLWKLSKRT